MVDNLLTASERSTILELYSRGFSYQEIAKRIGRGSSSVGRVVRKHGCPRPCTLSQEDRDEIVQLYKAGWSQSRIETERGHSWHTVRGVITESDVEKRSHSTQCRKVTEDDIERMRVLYLDGQSTYQIASTTGYSPSTVYTYISDAVEVRSKSEALRQYSIDETVFDQPDPRAHYWSGFLLADGSIRECDNRLTLTLARKDRSHLDKFRRFLQSDRPIRDNVRTVGGKKYKLSRFVACSSHLIQTLVEDYNIWPNKTYTATAPSRLCADRNFWRGVVDGDGDLGLNKNYPRIRLAGSKALVTQFKEFVLLNNETSSTVRSQGSIFRYSAHGPVAVKLAETLYFPSVVSLQRKRERARIIINSSNEES